MSDSRSAAPRLSPLSPGKWEYERRNHFYYLGSAEYRALSEAQKHVFLIGHRGTGKTTLLYSLDWGERISNLQLRSQLGPEPFADGNLGCFVGLKSLDLQLFESWLYEAPDRVSHLILGTYFRAIWIEEAVRAVQAVLRYLDFDELDKEAAALGPVADQLFAWLPETLNRDTREETRPLSLLLLRQMGARLRDLLHNAATLSTSTPQEMITELNLGRLQQLTNRIFHALAEILHAADDRYPWRFRMCMDEGEYLSDLARRTVRTLVRECESPLLMVIAALGDLGTGTVDPGVAITLDDREVLDLNSRLPNDLQILINGIVRARLEAAGLPCQEFDIRKLLGDPDLNQLLLAHPSENSRLAILKRVWTKPGQSEPRSVPRADSPIRAYLEELGRSASVGGSAPEEARRLDSAGYRKYQLAGYLRLLGDCGVDAPFFAGWRIFMHTADNSIRDLLFALESLKDRWWRTRRRPDRGVHMGDADYCDFLNIKVVSFRLQDQALRLLGQSKLRTFSSRVIHLTKPARRLVDFVGRTSHVLDFGLVPGPPLVGLDASKFVVQLPERPEVHDRISMGRRTRSGLVSQFVDVLLACGEEGFLVVHVNEESRNATFRLHHSLSRYYKCSYRSPQYSTVLSWDVIERVLTEPSHRSLARLTEQSIRTAKPPADQPRLFLPPEGEP